MFPQYLIMINAIIFIFKISAAKNFHLRLHMARKLTSCPTLQKQVIRTKSVEFMPFYLSLFSFLTGLLWMLYGILGRDPFLTVRTEPILAHKNLYIILTYLFSYEGTKHHWLFTGYPSVDCVPHLQQMQGSTQNES